MKARRPNDACKKAQTTFFREAVAMRYGDKETKERKRALREARELERDVIAGIYTT
jgi:hypothetical protein